MTKNDLGKTVAKMNDISNGYANELVTAVFDEIGDSLAIGESEVRIHGFGVFKTMVRSARKGRNPATGEEIDIPEKTVIKFKPSKTLSDKVTE